MDRLRHDDVERARRAAPADKFLQALDLMYAGIELKRAGIRSRKPGATEAEVETELRRWLLRNE